ncbi:reverse transcriptase domain-containing protein [Tanacetum coccineum]
MSLSLSQHAHEKHTTTVTKNAWDCKDSWPRLWDISSTGHVSAGDTSLITARSKLQEELGVTILNDAFELLFVFLQECILSSFPRFSKIMAAPAIAISSDSSDKSVGSPPSRVILFGDIPTVIPSTSVVAPETSTTALVISSTLLWLRRLLSLHLLDYDPYVATVARLRRRVTTCSSSPSDFPIAPVTAPPETRR